MSDRSLIPEMVYMYVIHKLGHSYGHYFPPRLEFYEREALTYSALITTLAFFATRSISVHLASLNIYKQSSWSCWGTLGLVGVENLMTRRHAPKRRVVLLIIDR